jgi:hypothetical protein
MLLAPKHKRTPKAPLPSQCTVFQKSQAEKTTNAEVEKEKKKPAQCTTCNKWFQTNDEKVAHMNRCQKNKMREQPLVSLPQWVVLEEVVVCWMGLTLIFDGWICWD